MKMNNSLTKLKNIPIKIFRKNSIKYTDRKKYKLGFYEIMTMRKIDLIEEYKLILEKKSTLSSRKRNFVKMRIALILKDNKK